MTKHIQGVAVSLLLLAGCSTTPPDVDAPLPGAPASPAPMESAPVPPPVAPVDANALFEQGMAAKRAGEYQLMLERLMAASDAGNADAPYELARLLSKGRIVERDPQAANQYLQRSAELGNPEALRVLAWNTLRGDGTPADVSQGEGMMRHAAETSVRAQRELGMLYANIYKPHLSSYAEAEHYLSLAAQQNDAEAAYHLGRLKEGSGDVMGAIEWYEAASQLGEAKAGAALAALQSGEPSAAPLLVPTYEYEQDASYSGVDADLLYQRAMELLTASRGQNLELEADAYALLVLASEQGHVQAAQELSFQGGIKQQMDEKDPQWLELAKQRALLRMNAGSGDSDVLE